jgi:uncharacterized protein (TIGR02679 family)
MMGGAYPLRRAVTASAVPSWLAEPGLSRLWEAARGKLERSHLTPIGRVLLTDLERAERHAVGDLLARPVVTGRVTIDLAELDEVLARRSPYRGLVEAIVAVTGQPLRDRRAERSAAAASREAPLTLARGLLAAQPPLRDVTWSETWLAGVRRSGLLARAEDPESVVRRAVAALAVLLAPDRAASSRADLAARITGDAHGLDDGTVAAQLALRALALDAGVELPTTPAARRDLWLRYGVSVDSVSSTCLTLGLLAPGDSAHARRLRPAAEEGDPVHLTPRDLRNLTLGAHRDVLVCENPRVLEAMADRFKGLVPVVCTAGQPALVVLDVLRQLVNAGAALHYHGDFDWPGIAIANRLVAEAGVQPWLMNATDYLAAATRGPATLALTGAPVPASWDSQLGDAMARFGVAVHEEAVLDAILVGAAAFA